MKSKNKIVRQYLRQVRKAVPCSGKERRQLVQQLEESVAQYVSEHGAETVDDISREFGSPGEIWEAFLQNNDAAYIQRQLALKNRVCRIVVIAAVVLMIVVAVLGTLRFIDFYRVILWRQYIQILRPLMREHWRFTKIFLSSQGAHSSARMPGPFFTALWARDMLYSRPLGEKKKM